MLINISGAGQPPEWALLELQGTLTPTAGPTFDGEALGRVLLEVRRRGVYVCVKKGFAFTLGGRGVLTRPPPRARQDSRLVLLVGNHRVVGKEETLPKPLHVLQLRPGAQEEDMGCASPPPEYVVRCIVRRKFVFTARPQPIISAAAALPTRQR